MYAFVIAFRRLNRRRELGVSDIAGLDLGLDQNMGHAVPVLQQKSKNADLGLQDEGLAQTRPARCLRTRCARR